MSATPTRPVDPRTRRAILELLKWSGPQDAGTLAGRLAVSAMAVRQHLYALVEDGLVTSVEEARPIGRPAKLWQLTTAANELFPNAHAELSLSLIQSVRGTFGERGIQRLIAARTKEQVVAYRAQMPRRASLRRRLEALARHGKHEPDDQELHREAQSAEHHRRGSKNALHRSRNRHSADSLKSARLKSIEFRTMTGIAIAGSNYDSRVGPRPG